MVPTVGDDVPGAQAGDDLQGVLQAVEALTDGRELDAELAVLVLEPCGAHRELEAAVARVVDGDGLPRRGLKGAGRSHR